MPPVLVPEAVPEAVPELEPEPEPEPGAAAAREEAEAAEATRSAMEAARIAAVEETEQAAAAETARCATVTAVAETAGSATKAAAAEARQAEQALTLADEFWSIGNYRKATLTCELAVTKAQGANHAALTARCEQRAQASAVQEAAEAHLHRLHSDCVVLMRGESVYTDATRAREIYTEADRSWKRYQLKSSPTGASRSQVLDEA